MNKYESIITNYINGNISSAKEEVRGLSTAETLHLVNEWVRTTRTNYKEVIERIMTWLG